MSDETPKDEMDEVEGHGGRFPAYDEPVEDGDDEVEAHMRSDNRSDARSDARAD